MSKVAIELIFKKHVWIDKEDWLNGLDEELPTDMEDVDFIEDLTIKSSTELIDAKFLGEVAEGGE